MQICAIFKRTVAFACVIVLSGCAGTHHSSMTLAESLTPPQQRAAQHCPNGKVMVCDKRRAAKCRCSSMRHLRALIGA